MPNGTTVAALGEMLFELSVHMRDPEINFKARKKIGGAITRLHDAISYIEGRKVAEVKPQAVSNAGLRRFHFLCTKIRQAVEQKDCTLAVIDYGRFGRVWWLKVQWHQSPPGDTITYGAYRSASAAIRDWSDDTVKE